MPFGLAGSIASLPIHLSWRLGAWGACVIGGDRQVRRVEIVFAGNPDEGEQGITPGVGEGGAHLMRRRSFADRAYRPVGRDPFSGRMGEDRGEPNEARHPCRSRLSARSRSRACPASCARYRARSKAMRSGTCDRLPSGTGTVWWRPAIFPGLVSSDWALASALAMAPIDSLERCMIDLRSYEVETDGAGF